jgi:alpha-L-rhamnosidase
MASHNSPYGKIASKWKMEDGKFTLTVTVPVNTQAKIYIPSTGSDLSENGKALPMVMKEEGPGYDYLVVTKGSGTYTFTSTYSP